MLPFNDVWLRLIFLVFDVQGRGASGGGSLSSYSGKGSGSEGGYYHNKNMDNGPYQSGGGSLPELEQDLDGGYEEKGLHAQTLEELEQRFLQETMELTKDQNVEEDKEKAKHREVHLNPVVIGLH